MTYAPDRPGGSAAGIIVGVLLVFGIIAFIGFVSLAQVSSSGTGSTIMSRTVAEMTEIDASITNIHTSLQESIGENAQDPVRVPNFPIPVDISRANALSTDRQQLRDEILRQAGDQLYGSGAGVWDDTDLDASQNIGTQSTAGGIRTALGLVRGTPHTIYLALAVVSGLATAALAITLTLRMDALRRLLAFGVILLAAGTPGIVITLLLRLATGSLGDDPFRDGLSDIGVDAQGVVLRNYVIITALGAGLVALGLAGALLSSRENEPDGLSFDPHA